MNHSHVQAQKIYTNSIAPFIFYNDTTFSSSYLEEEGNEKTYVEDYEMHYEGKRFQERKSTKCIPDIISQCSSTVLINHNWNL